MNCIWKMFSFCNNLSVNNKIITVKSRRQRYLDVAFINNSREAVSLRFKVLVNSMLIIEDPTVNVECRTALKWLFFDFNLCWSTICWIVSQLHLHPYSLFINCMAKAIKNETIIFNWTIDHNNNVSIVKY